MSYENVIDAINEHSLSWDEIDRILLNPDTYEEMQERASFVIADHYTSDKPAVREVDGRERIVYVSKSGVEVSIEL